MNQLPDLFQGCGGRADRADNLRAAVHGAQTRPATLRRRVDHLNCPNWRNALLVTGIQVIQPSGARPGTQPLARSGQDRRRDSTPVSLVQLS
jgi:hypothetical protein